MDNLKWLAAALVLAGTFAATAQAGDDGNWARAKVRAWQAAMAERVLGREAAEAYLATPEIVGGDTAAPGRWPAQVALVTASVANNFQAQFCGGSLIGERHVLTAAHCVDFLKSPGQIEVLTGTQSLSSGGTRHAVRSVTIHPDWNDNTADYDLAVLVLETAATGTRVNRIIKPRQARRFEKHGKPAMVTGWGNLTGNGNSYPTELQEVRVPFVSRSVCNRPVSYDGGVTRRMICAGYRDGGKDACQGDSGGPLVLKRKKRVQAGIVSWGIGCAEPDLYGVYTHLAVLRGWIMATVAAD